MRGTPKASRRLKERDALACSVLLWALLACSAAGGEEPGTDGAGSAAGSAGASSSGSGGTAPEAGAPNDAGSPSGTGGAAGSGGAPDLCTDGDERLCSCAPGYGGKQTCGVFGWNTCICPDWPPEGGGGGTGGSGGIEGAWPTCPRDPLDTTTARYPNGCPVSWLQTGFDEPTCTVGTNAVPNSGYCTFDCREPYVAACADKPTCVPPLVFSESRFARCQALGGTCSELQTLCLPQ